MTVQFSSDMSDACSVSRPLNELPKTSNTVSTKGIYRNGMKRCIDICATVLAIPVVLPLVGVLALIVALDGHNPFYSQKRIGRNGKTFRMWKLRSMVHNADTLLEAYLAANPAARQEWDTTQKLKQDPRITFVGRILRKTSVDELPQLLNVLNGTMSLVGPRPMMVCQKDAYVGEGYYRLRPGITGPWQVSDRNHCRFIDRVKYDDAYEKNLSFKTDLKLLLKTIAVVTRGTGY
jgi:lipopolysaccharide/colanic/teichoic acid biosynthesis glycosyltransferase